MKACTLIITCAFGLEKLVKRELQDLGFNQCRVSDGKLEIEASLQDIPRLNIHLRTADRVVLKLAEYNADNFDDLFDGAQQVDWSIWIPKTAKITVTGAITRSTIDSVRVCQSMIKKAIVQQLQSKYQTDWLEESGDEYTIKVALLKDVVQLTLDTTGAGLHKRGYRQEAGEAPMRENLAAALVMLSFWKPDRVLIDPLCGAGTILIEAALLARRMAPGQNRSFVSESWDMIGTDAWTQARTQARDQIRTDIQLRLFGSDQDKQRVEDARVNANNAGVFDDIEFQQADAKQITLEHDYGIMISNPPYGQKIGTERELELLYKSLHNIFSARRDWSIYVITADKRFPDYFNRAKPDRVRKLYNGNVEANYYQYYGTRPPRGS